MACVIQYPGGQYESSQHRQQDLDASDHDLEQDRSTSHDFAPADDQSETRLDSHEQDLPSFIDWNRQVTVSDATAVSRAPSTRATSPMSLAWTNANWAPGHFSFTFDASLEEDEHGIATANRPGPITAELSSADKDVTQSDPAGLSEVSETVPKSTHEPTPTVKLGSSRRLEPTAQPFVSTRSTADQSASRLSLHGRRKQLDPLVTSLQPLCSSIVAVNDTEPDTTLSSTSTGWGSTSSAISPTDFCSHACTDQAELDQGWHLNEHGQLVNAEACYTIADEILHLQDLTVVDPPPLSASEGYGGRVYTKIPDLSPASRRKSETSPALGTRQSMPHLPDHSHSAVSGLTSIASVDRPRSLSMSTGSTRMEQHHHSHGPSVPFYPPQTAAAQLSSYFGPSSVDVNIDQQLLPRDSSSLQGLPLQTESEDILYVEARETFIAQSFAALGTTTPSEASRQAMLAHFDRAMHSSHPLAMLYDLTHEAANALAADPKCSGVSDNVLKLSLIRGQQTKAAGPGGLAGPSANNRKLGLYKTELCRSWEEKGSCRYGTKCQFAHGAHELREVQRHPKFKSEVCRTFWLHGACPYGRRCCFIHTTVPGGASSHGNVQPPTTAELAASTSCLSRLARASSSSSISRMPSRASSSSSLSAQHSSTKNGTVTPQRGSFGPNLADYLDSSVTSSPDSARASSLGSPIHLKGNESGNGTMSDAPLIGLGLKPPGRFTSNPGEVPPTYQDPPKSRLHRLASLSNPSLQQPTSRLTARASSLSMTAQFGSDFPTKTTTTGAVNPQASPMGIRGDLGATEHSRNLSASSHNSSSIWSPSSSNAFPRTSSSSSLSSQYTSSASPFTTAFAPALQPVAGNWLGEGQGPTSSSSSSSPSKNNPGGGAVSVATFLWPPACDEEGCEDDENGLDGEYINMSFAEAQHQYRSAAAQGNHNQVNSSSTMTMHATHIGADRCHPSLSNIDRSQDHTRLASSSS